MGQMDKGVSGTDRVMKDWAKWMEGEMESTEPDAICLHHMGQCQISR
jgi:hypothetical protein